MHAERTYAFVKFVNVSADQAFDFIVDPNNLPKWDSSIDHVLVVPGETHFVVYLRSCPYCFGLARVVYTVLAVRGGQEDGAKRVLSYLIRGMSAGFETREVAECKEITETSCSVNYTVKVKYTGWRVLLLPFIEARVRHITHAAGARLKRMLEADLGESDKVVAPDISV